MSRQPTLFISHGSPDIVIAETEATKFLRRLAAGIERPDAIVVASAHFEGQGRVLVSGDARPTTIHDFGGFDPRLYNLRYSAPGSPELAEDIRRMVVSAGLPGRIVIDRGFDHGTWVPLMLAFPDADIPVVQVSVDAAAGPAYHLKLGEALGVLSDRNILIVGSGSFTHNLREAFDRIRGGRRRDATPAWVLEFTEWMTDKILAGDRLALADYRDLAPHARDNHPTDEHLMPLYVAIGAAGKSARASKLHASRDFGVLSMEAFAFR